MNINKILANVEKFVGIKCTHRSVKSDSCNFCPDCGKKIIARWVSIKCRKCGLLRTAKKSGLHSIVPKKNFCAHCGSAIWGYQYYYDSNIPDKLREISVKQIIENKENPFIYNNIGSDTKIWVENPQNNNKKYKSNVIKANIKREK